VAGGVGTFSGTNTNQLDCGIAPTKANQREAAYDFSAELSFQYRNAAVGAVPALAGLKKDAANQFIKFVGDPDVLNTLGAAAKEATIALPINFDPTANSNVAKATRFGNSCAPLQKAF
jgi:spermidine/putrescine-binding protein